MQTGSFLSGPRVSSQSIFAKGLKWAALAQGHPLEVRGPSFAGPSPKSTSPLAAVSARPDQRGSSEAASIGIERGVGGLMADIVEFRGGADKYRTREKGNHREVGGG